MAIELPARGLTVYTTQRGERGPLVLFVPGAGADHVGWGVVMRTLRDEIRAVAYDPRGTGRTRGDASQVGVEVLAGDLVAIVETLGEPVHVVAHSLGTRVALEAGAVSGERIASLTLFSPWYRTDPYFLHQAAMMQEIATRGDRRVAAQTLLWLLTSRALQVEEPERFEQFLDAMFLSAAATEWTTIVRQLRAGRESPVADATLDRVRVPVQVVVAEHDRMVDPAYSLALARRMDAPVVRLTGPRASHLAHVEMPIPFADAVRAFLARVGEPVGHG